MKNPRGYLAHHLFRRTLPDFALRGSKCHSSIDPNQLLTNEPVAPTFPPGWRRRKGMTHMDPKQRSLKQWLADKVIDALDLLDRIEVRRNEAAMRYYLRKGREIERRAQEQAMQQRTGAHAYLDKAAQRPSPQEEPPPLSVTLGNPPRLLDTRETQAVQPVHGQRLASARDLARLSEIKKQERQGKPR